MIYTLKNGSYEAKISSLGAELISFRQDGKESIWYGSAPYWQDHAPLLFPICGRLLNDEYSYGGKVYKMTGHGFAKRSEFECISQSEKKLVLSLKENDATLEIYPFKFEFIATYELGDDGALSLAVRVKNTDEKTMPYMFGWHPGFNLISDGGAEINDYCIDFGNLTELTIYPLIENTYFASTKPDKYTLTNGKILINEDYIYPRDTLLMFDHENKCTLGTDKNGFRAELSWSDNLPLLALWKQNKSGARFFCLEPWTQMPSDGSHEEVFETRNMERLESGDEKEYSYKLKIKF